MLFGIRKIKFHRWGFEVVINKKIREFKGKPIYVEERMAINIWRPFLNIYKIMTSSKGKETLVIEYPRQLNKWAISGPASDEKTIEQRELEKRESLEKEKAANIAARKIVEDGQLRKDLKITKEQLEDLLKKAKKNG
jgi:hypothetical protein